MKKKLRSKPEIQNKSPQANLQGEGDYEAARRYRDDVEKFVHTADIEAAARAAAPHDEREIEEMAAAETAGRSHAKLTKPAPKRASRKP